MVKILLELPDDVNKKIEHYKIDHELKDKKAAIIDFIRKYPEAKAR